MVTSFGDYSKKEKFKRFFNIYRVRWNNVLASILNSHKYIIVRDFMINMIFSATVYSLILWLFGLNYPMRRGLGIAVTIYTLQYLIKWYYGVKPSNVTEIKVKEINVRNR